MDIHKFKGTHVTVGGVEFELGDHLGSGAEGAVYRAKESSSYVIKIFEPDKRDSKAEKIQAMITNTPEGLTVNHKGVHSIVWPANVVTDPTSESFLGYTMPCLNLENYLNAQRYARECLMWDQSTEEERYKTALNITRVVNAVHNQGHAIGDFNHQNILINDGYVSLIDCDGFHIKSGNKIYPGATFFNRYTPPEGRADSLSDVRTGDLFGLGVHIFQLLMEGFHPFQAMGEEATSGSFGDMIKENAFPYENPTPGMLEPNPAAPDYERLPTELKSKFSDCFVYGKRRHSARPTAKDWEIALSDVCSTSVSVPDNGKEPPASDEPQVTGRQVQTTTNSASSTATNPSTSTSGTSTNTAGSANNQSNGNHKNSTGSNTGKQSGGSTTTSNVNKKGNNRLRRRNQNYDSPDQNKSSILKPTYWGNAKDTILSELLRLMYYIGGFIVIILMAYGITQI